MELYESFFSSKACSIFQTRHLIWQACDQYTLNLHMPSKIFPLQQEVINQLLLLSVAKSILKFNIGGNNVAIFEIFQGYNINDIHISIPYNIAPNKKVDLGRTNTS